MATVDNLIIFKGQGDIVKFSNTLITGQIITCANGIDFSAMSATLNLVDHLTKNYKFDDNCSANLLTSLRQGVLLSRAGKNRSHDHFLLTEQMFPEYIP